MKRIKSFFTKCKKFGIPIDDIINIEKLVGESGGKIYLIGGNVRDLIMEKHVTSHPDIVVNIQLDVLIDCLNKSNFKFSKIGSEFGSLIVFIKNLKIDVTCMRSDIKTDGRWAKIKFTNNLEKDSQRRDFTINSIYCDTSGYLSDPNNGIKDLLNKKVRFVGQTEKRIKEDYLRILRFFRFSISLSRSFDKKNLEICNKNLSKIKKLSYGRRVEEIKKIILNENIERKNNLAKLTRLFEYSIETKLNFNNFKRLCYIESKLNDKNFERRIKFLLRSKNTLPFFFKNNASKALRDRLLIKLKFNKFSLFELNSNLYKFDKTFIIDKLIFDWCDKLISKNLFDAFFYNALNYKKKSLPLNGQDLVNIGFKEGKHLGNVIKRLEVKWIEENFKFTKKDSIKFVKRFLPRS